MEELHVNAFAVRSTYLSNDKTAAVTDVVTHAKLEVAKFKDGEMNCLEPEHVAQARRLMQCSAELGLSVDDEYHLSKFLNEAEGPSKKRRNAIIASETLHSEILAYQRFMKRMGFTEEPSKEECLPHSGSFCLDGSGPDDDMIPFLLKDALSRNRWIFLRIEGADDSETASPEYNIIPNYGWGPPDHTKLRGIADYRVWDEANPTLHARQKAWQRTLPPEDCERALHVQNLTQLVPDWRRRAWEHGNEASARFDEAMKVLKEEKMPQTLCIYKIPEEITEMQQVITPVAPMTRDVLVVWLGEIGLHDTKKSVVPNTVSTKVQVLLAWLYNHQVITTDRYFQLSGRDSMPTCAMALKKARGT